MIWWILGLIYLAGVPGVYAVIRNLQKGFGIVTVDTKTKIKLIFACCFWPFIVVWLIVVTVYDRLTR